MARLPQWYRLYYCLAALDVVTVAASLTLGYFMMQIYVNSVAMSQQWARREADYRQLAALARAVNAPGNDVFDSRDADAESARLHAALGRFDEHFAAARADLAHHARAHEAAVLARSFDSIAHTMREMLAEAELIFAYFSAGEAQAAAQRMATMDRKYASVNEAMARLLEGVADIRQEHFDQQLAMAGTLRHLEHLILGLAALMVAGALYYGSKLYRAGRAAEVERAEQLQALIRARADADAANKAKSKFLAMMSHEVRTPLNTMLLALELLDAEGPPHEKRGYAAMARSSARSLQRLADDLLQFFKLEADKTELERVCFDLRALLQDTLATYVHRAAEKGLSFIVAVDPELPTLLAGDPLRFGQIVGNLVDNAVKFTEAGAIEVSVTRGTASAQKMQGGVPVRVVVRDTGIGLTPAQCALVFDEFAQVQTSTTREYGGIGLGLAIVRRLVALMGGNLAVDSHAGIGSTFTFDVELAAVESAAQLSAAPTQSVKPTESLAGRRVLLVEDAPDGREACAAILRRLGLDVDIACNGAQAVAAIGAKHYDAVLMDIAMPVMDGFTAAQRIRDEEPDGREVPIIAVSAHATQAMFERCLEAGIDDCLVKPVTQESLAAALLRWVEPAAAKS